MSRISTRTVRNLSRIALSGLAWLAVVGAIIFFSAFIYLARTVPSPDAIATRHVSESTKILDRTGETLLYDIHGDEKRTVVPWDGISPSIKSAVVATEDGNFYQHRGLDMKGVLRAFIKNIQHGNISGQGGSTITQQLVGNALVGREKTYARKIKELILAVAIERRFSKEQILWMYLNQIPFGSNVYGIETASRAYFGKTASDVTLAEAATLAAMIQAPTYYSPYGTHGDELAKRKDFVLGRMHDLGFISDSDYAVAKEETISFTSNQEGILAPHFVFMVRDYLIQKYGEDMVERGGLTITTTLDTRLQAIAEDEIEKYGDINEQRYKAGNAAFVALDPKTGELLALVGSRDYFNIEHEGNFNVATAMRQPGSSFKPFAYATALSHGYPDYTILFDAKTEFNPYCSPEGTQTKDRFGLDCYHPRNYDGTFRGPITLRQGLAQSLNIPSVKTLYLAGIPETIDVAERMGITTLGDRDRFGLSLVLGGAEVRLVDLVSAYGVFANDGIRDPWTFIKKVQQSDGTILEEHESQSARALPAQIARMINNILSDNQARAPVFGYNSPLYIQGRDVAGKTGTTQENRDAWVIGYSPNLAAGVWVGNNQNQSMTQAGAGISAAGPLWREFMVRALDHFPDEHFLPPDPIFSSKPMLNGSFLGQREDGTREIHTILYYVDKKNPLGPAPVNPGADEQYPNWEWAVRTFFGAAQ